MSPFQPLYIFESELGTYGLPDAVEQTDIMNLVAMASSLIDVECGRVDGDGGGSLVFTTYTQRILKPTRNRNLLQVSAKPIVGIPQGTVNELIAAASGAFNPFYTGVVASTQLNPLGQLSGIVAASGRYGYTRQDMSMAYPDLFAMINPLNLITLFGGPAPWVAMDVTNTDYDSKFGEVWLPAGLQLQSYSEVLLTYNSGYDPRRMPSQIKHVCAALVKNALAKGDGTTAMLTMSLGKSGANATFYKELVDPTMDAMLQPFRTVRAL